MVIKSGTSCQPRELSEKGATTVEYAFIVVAIILALFLTVIYLVNPSDPTNSLLPSTYTSIANHAGNFEIKNIPTN